VQGAELSVLRGAGVLMDSVEDVQVEVSKKPFYHGGVLYPELNQFLLSKGLVAKAAPASDHCDVEYQRKFD
jgi:hypothetical protein